MSGRVLVTGGDGFVGRSLAADLHQSGWQVTVAARHPTQVGADIDVVEMPDLSTCDDWSQVFDRSYEAVVHLAARVHAVGESAHGALAQYVATNAHGTRSLAQAAEQGGVKRFILMSSVKVYGNTQVGARPLRPADAAIPDDPYGISKKMAEDGLREICRASSTMDCVVIRPPLVYGPGVRANFRSMMSWVRSRVPLPFGLIDNRRSLIFIHNLTSVITAALTSEEVSGTTLLVSDDHDVSTPELLRRISSAMGQRRAQLLPVPPSVLRLAGRVTGREAMIDKLLTSLQVDTSDTIDKLGWRPPYTVDEGIDVTVRAYLRSRVPGSLGD